MRIHILNYNPKSIAELIDKVSNTLPNNIVLAPISIDFSFIKIEQNIENSKLTITSYDYYDKEGKIADYEIDDSSLEFDDVIFQKGLITVNDNSYKLMPFSTLKPKKTPR